MTMLEPSAGAAPVPERGNTLREVASASLGAGGADMQHYQSRSIQHVIKEHSRLKLIAGSSSSHTASG